MGEGAGVSVGVGVLLGVGEGTSVAVGEGRGVDDAGSGDGPGEDTSVLRPQEGTSVRISKQSEIILTDFIDHPESSELLLWLIGASP